MVDLGALTGQLNIFSVMTKLVFYGKWTLILALLSIIGYMVMHIVTFPYKMTIFPLYGSGRNNNYSISKPRSNRVKWNKNKTAWVLMYPLFKGKEIEPFDSDYIYPGKTLIAFEDSGNILPGQVELTNINDSVTGCIKPVPYHIRNWQSLAYKKHAIEFASDNWWEQNKMLVYMIIAVGICCVLCGFTVYYTYQYATAGMGKMDLVATAINNVGMIPGK